MNFIYLVTIEVDLRHEEQINREQINHLTSMQFNTILKTGNIEY